MAKKYFNYNQTTNLSRFGHTACLYEKNKIIVFGGCNHETADLVGEVLVLTVDSTDRTLSSILPFS